MLSLQFTCRCLCTTLLPEPPTCRRPISPVRASWLCACLLLASLSSQVAFLLRAANAAGADAGVRLCEALDTHYFAYPGANEVSLRALMQTDPSGSWCQQEFAVQIDSQSGFIATPVPGAVVTERFGKVLYLRPTRLDDQALSETAAALASEPRGRGLVIDLRNVQGGSVAATLEFADLFLSEGQLARSWRRGRVHDHPEPRGSRCRCCDRGADGRQHARWRGNAGIHVARQRARQFVWLTVAWSSGGGTGVPWSRRACPAIDRGGLAWS